MRVASWFPLAVLVGWIGADMADGTTASSASAVIVAVVDIEEVIGGLEQRADAERKLQARAAKIQLMVMRGNLVCLKQSKPCKRPKVPPPSVRRLWRSKILSSNTKPKWPTGMTSWRESASNCGNRSSQRFVRKFAKFLRPAAGTWLWQMILPPNSSLRETLEAQYKQFMRTAAFCMPDTGGCDRHHFVPDEPKLGRGPPRRVT